MQLDWTNCEQENADRHGNYDELQAKFNLNETGQDLSHYIGHEILSFLKAR